jgi:broad specificity phosphatase PhoE
MILYLVRHGETDCNLKKIIQGQSVPSRLNEAGRKQAALAACRLKNCGITHAYTSPLERAAETAEIICRPMGLRPVPEPLLSERSFGVLEGKTREEIERVFPVKDCPWRQAYSAAPPGGESLMDVAERGRRFAEEIKKRHSEDDVIMAVAHGGTLRGMILYLLDLPPEYWRTFDFGNTSISVFELGERVRARRINDTAHLEALAGEIAEDADNALPGSLSLYEK